MTLLEVRITGRAGKDNEKFIQVYSSVRPLRDQDAKEYKSLRSRKLGVLNSLDSLLAQSEKTGGVRFEIILRSSIGASTCQRLLGLVQKVHQRIGHPLQCGLVVRRCCTGLMAEHLSLCPLAHVSAGMSGANDA